jgi:putative ABC transport system permease protein
VAPRPSGLFAVLSSPPWRRAPGLLLRRPGVLASVAGASTVLAAAVAGVPLFLSSAASESVAVQAAERCPRDTGVNLGAGFAVAGVPRSAADRSLGGAVPPELPRLGPGDPVADPFEPLGEQLGPSALWLVRRGLELRFADDSTALGVALLTRDRAPAPGEVIEGSPGPGVWLSDRAQHVTGLAPGDRAYFAGVEGGMPVAGIYREPGFPLDDTYWCAHGDLLLPDHLGASLLPPVVLADRATFLEVMRALGVPAVAGAWEAPLARDLTLAEADELVTGLGCGTDAAPRLAWCTGVEIGGAEVDGAVTGPAPAVRVPAGQHGLSGFEQLTDDAIAYGDADDFVSRALLSHLPFVTERSRSIRASVAGGVAPVSAFAALAGVALVGASASMWFDRRRREVMLLTVRGVAPAALGAKAVLELVIAVLAGSVAGLAVAYGLVVWLGPSTLVEPAALGWAVAATAAALVASLLTVGVVVARRARSHSDRGRRRAWLSRVPWEVLLGVVTLVSYRRLGEWGVPVSDGAEVTRVDVLALFFPVLFLLTGVAVSARVLALALPSLRVVSERLPMAPFLAVRRVDRYRVGAIGLVAASAVAAGVLGYAATLTRSLEASLDAKARTYVGSDLAVRLIPDQELPGTVADRATKVEVYRRGRLNVAGRQGVNVVAVDPATFGRAAFWDPAFSDASLTEVLDRLAAPAGDGPVPAVVVGIEPPDDAELTIREGVEVASTTLAIEPVADVGAFPGVRRGTPTVYVAASTLGDLGVDNGTPEAWIRGDREESLTALADAGIVFAEHRRFEDVVDRAAFLTVSWTFSFMRSLGIAAGLVVLGGVVFTLDARRRAQVLGYAFARRMGLTPATHVRSLLVELTATVFVGCCLGLGIALVGSWLAYGRIDPVPDFQPDPLLRPALTTMAILGAIALIVIALGAALGQRRANRDDPLDVLRAGV